MNYQIGNYISTEYGDLPIKHVVFDKYQVIGKDGRILWANKVEPIKLTEELLINSNMIQDNYRAFYLGIIFIKKCEINGETKFDIHIGEHFGETKHFIYIYYLHELQNIISLTGEKLTLTNV